MRACACACVCVCVCVREVKDGITVTPTLFHPHGVRLDDVNDGRTVTIYMMFTFSGGLFE